MGGAAVKRARSLAGTIGFWCASIAVTAAVVLALGCGHAKQYPFAGTWTDADGESPPWLVIQQTADGYRARVEYPGGVSDWLALTQKGNTLRHTGADRHGDVTITYYPAEDRLSYHDGSMSPHGLWFWVRATASPSPSTR